MNTYNHQCPCGETYTDNDPEVYFCPNCIRKRKQIAEEVNKKLAGKVSKRISGGFNSIITMGQTVPSDKGGTMTFLRASDLGL